jgi:large subunit ribosomal protein L32
VQFETRTEETALALPKRRHSIARQGKRRANWKARRPNLVPCPDCRALRLTHRVCPACGNYAGETVLAIKAHMHRGRS